MTSTPAPPSGPDTALPTPTVNLTYNQDIFVPADVAAQFPLCRTLLHFMPLCSAFDNVDVDATINKARFHFWGRISLALTFIALTGLAVETCFLGFGSHAIPYWLTLSFETAAAVAIMIYLIVRKAQFRGRWLEACYKRERMRQWRWQAFLCGPIIEEFIADESEKGSEQTRFVKRWKELVGTFEAHATSAAAFRKRAASPLHLMFRREPYSKPEVAEEVFRLLDLLRFRYQVQYPESRTGQDEMDTRPPLHEHHEFAETVARAMLVLALILPILHLSFLAAEMLQDFPVSSGVHISFFVSALWAAVLSGLARAYRAGMTAPEEAESYEDYAGRMGALSEIYLRTPDEALRQQLHEELEIEAERELRRFLVMKNKASFVA